MYISVKTADRLERAFAILGLSFFVGSFTGLIGVVPPGIYPSPALNTLLRYVVWFGALLLLVPRWQKTLRVMAQDIFLWIITILAILSFLWSDFRDFVYLNSREVMQMTAFGLYFAVRFTLKDQVKLLAWTMALGITLSILVCLAFPSIGIHQGVHSGAWRGVYIDKNYFGSLMVMSLVVFFVLPIEQARDRLCSWLGMAMSALMLILATSRTSLTLSIFLILILSFYRNFRWRGKQTVLWMDLGILIVGSISTVLFSNWVEIVVGMGRDPTLSGRTHIWSIALYRFWERPLLGFGRGAFWAPGSRFAAEASPDPSLTYIPPHGHNGFVDLLLDIGLIGFSCFLISFGVAYIRSLSRAYETKRSENLWPLGFLTFLVMNNMTESLLLYLNTIYWVLYVAIVLSVGQKDDEYQES
ncbi:MAG: O-antigen ligase family protein [Leptolyngbyaceae cyanobacterium bins.59]|nr:O-antigen ligase family protein [Leptolyngbyaceae cyanobacterium bins.59]